MNHDLPPQAQAPAGNGNGGRLQRPADPLECSAGRSAEKPTPQSRVPGCRDRGTFEGQVALIIGADSGAGHAVAALFGREGADVAVVCSGEDGDADAVRRCIEGEGRRCLVLHGDVRDAACCKQAVQRTVEVFGRLDVLINNAAFHATAASIRP